MSRKGDLTTSVVDGLTLDDGMLFHDQRGRVRDLRPAPVPIADTHGHLTSFRGHDPSLAICRAALAGVRLLVVPVDPIDDVPHRFQNPQAFLDWLAAPSSLRRFHRIWNGIGAPAALPAPAWR